MPEERNFRYSENGVSFRLYRDDALREPRQLQCDLSKDPLADHGLRFSKFFGRWATTGRRNPEDTGLVLLEEVQEQRQVRNKQNQWVNKEAWTKTSPILDWLDPSPDYLDPAIAEERATKWGPRPKDTLPKLKIGDGVRLAAAGKRLKALAAAQGGLCFDLVLASRLLTGIGLPHPTENGFLFHPTLAVPYLRGTALKQVVRDFAEEEGAEPEPLDRLFGSLRGKAPGAGLVAFLDALPLGPVELTAEQITPHYGGYYALNPATTPGRTDSDRPADWHDPVPVTLLAVEPGQAYRFVILPLRRQRDALGEADLQQLRDWLVEGLAWNGIGAKTTLGFGRFAEAAKRPLAVGDRIKVSANHETENLRGRAGVVEMVFAPQGMAKVKLDGGGRGSNPAIKLAFLSPEAAEEGS